MARARAERAVNPLLHLAYADGRCWLQSRAPRGCDDGWGSHWHEISRGLAACLTNGEWTPWETDPEARPKFPKKSPAQG